ncbi:hypothetical protein [Pseudodesulfovibrio methanolicus]|uniref:Uncharacterized protein n=1 Tax=Pseudodesulfovibrio methanolicus TaxID=3126690 RepID=A0ABZ2ITJ9_9BACT
MRLVPEKCPVWAWIVPPLLLIAVVAVYAVDVLQWDEWVIWGELLHKIKAGTFGLADLAAQQNEQRNMAARVFGLLLMPLFKLNRFAEYGVNFLLAAGSFWAAVVLYGRTFRQRITPFVALIFSMLSFSLLQWEAFTFGANSSVLILPLGIWLGVLIAAGGPPSLLRLSALAVVGILPSFSFANGLFYWFCLAPLLYMQARKSGNVVRTLSIWGGLTALVWFLYFYSFQFPPQHPSLSGDLAAPFRMAGYFMAYLGSAVSSDKNLMPLAVAIGACSLCLLGRLLWDLLRCDDRDQWRAAMPWSCVMLFTLFSAGVTALARSGFGLAQALESRYASYATPYWMALFVLFLLAWKRDKTTHRLILGRNFLVFCAGVFLLSTLLSFIVIRNREPRFAKARKALFSLTSDSDLAPIFPDTAYLFKQLPMLLADRLSLYRDIKRFDEYDKEDKAGGAFSVVEKMIGAQGQVKGLLLQGVVTRDQSGVPVLIVVGNRIVGVSTTREEYWELFLPTAWLPEGTVMVRAYAVLEGGERIAPLAPEGGGGVAVAHGPEPEYSVSDYFFIN